MVRSHGAARRGVVTSWLRRRWELPLTRGLDLDDPRTTELRRQVLAGKPCLRRIYSQWYRRLSDALPPPPGRVLELGSGAGFFRQCVPDAIGSDLLTCSGVDLVLDARRLPMRDECLRGIVMTNVLHHVPDPTAFFDEAWRCVRAGGVIAMIEPWHNRWAGWVYRHLHHEPFDPDAQAWRIDAGGPLSGANGALPWIMFVRDRAMFTRRWPGWHIRSIDTMMPLRYLLSGGVSLRNAMPWGTDHLVAAVERLMPGLGLFACIVLEKYDP